MPALEELLSADGPAAPVYLVAGEPVLAEPAAERLARALAERAGCEPEIHRHPPSLAPLLDDLRTYSLFAGAKVVLAIDSAILADRTAAADLVDDAAAALPLSGGEPSPRERQAASRLLQALRLFGVDPHAGTSEAAVGKLPDWALAGGAAFRRRRNGRGRGKRQVQDLAEGLAALLDAARNAELSGFAESDAGALAAAVDDGLPEGHSLVLAERTAAADHPVVAALEKRGLVVRLGEVESDRQGWQGVGALATELERQTGSGIARDALAELTRRTLRKDSSDWKSKGANSDSTARFAAEYRKLAGIAGGGRRIDRALVERVVEDRGEEDAFGLLDAIGAGRGDEALERLRRLLAGADDLLAARLSFFALLSGWCRRVAAVRGLMEAQGVRPGESSYPRFKSRMVPRLQGEMPGGVPAPLSGEHPYALHRAYLAAGRLSRRQAAQVPAWVLDTELAIKGESGEPDAALAHLVSRMAAALRGGA